MGAVTLYTAILLVIIATVPVKPAQSDCENLNTPAARDECFLAIKSALQDKTLFWFGEGFMEKCLEESTPLIGCTVNFAPNPMGYSLGEFLFPDPAPALDDLSQTLAVTYHSLAGEYRACEHDFIIDEEVTFNLDPLSNQSYPAWNTRAMPEVTWTSETDVQYSLFMVDAANGVLHGAWMNIQGHDISSGVVMKSYRQPGTVSLGRGNVYTFLLYKQTSQNMSVEAEWTQLVNVQLPEQFNLTALTSPDAMDLIGPVAVNWVLVVGDAYSVSHAWTNRWAMNCAPFVKQAFEDQRRDFMDTSNINLDVYVNITFNSPARSYQACCTTTTYAEEELVFDPIGSGRFAAIQLQSSTPLSINLIPNRALYMSQFYFSGQNYTLLVVDADVRIPTAGTSELPVLHGLYTNLAVIDGNLDLSSGTVLESYKGPQPPDQPAHHYFFLLLEQQFQLDLNSTTAYTGSDCMESIRTRCLFNVTKFVNDNNVRLVGMSWVSAANDDWVDLQWGKSESEICAGRAGYGDPCPTAAAPASCYSNGTLLFLTLLFLFSRVN